MIADIALTLMILGFLVVCCAGAVGAEWLARRWRRNRSTQWRGFR